MHRYKIFIVIGAVLGLNIVGWGAFLATLLLGICPMATEPKNWWMNQAIQILTGCFTYVVTITFPWRFGNLVHLMDTPRSQVGMDFYGREVNMVRASTCTTPITVA